jgi:hypothetical protein
MCGHLPHLPHVVCHLDPPSSVAWIQYIALPPKDTKRPREVEPPGPYGLPEMVGEFRWKGHRKTLQGRQHLVCPLRGDSYTIARNGHPERSLQRDDFARLIVTDADFAVR